MGEKASPNIGKRYWLIVLKGKSYSCTNTKSIFGYALIVWSTIWNSFFILLSFFNLSLFSSFSFLLSSFSLNPFLCYILWFLYHFLHPRVSQVLGVSLPHFAAYLLFRHHLHINAARELAGQHLMQRKQYFQIFCYPSSLSFIWYLPIPLSQSSFNMLY